MLNRFLILSAILILPVMAADKTPEIADVSKMILLRNKLLQEKQKKQVELIKTDYRLRKLNAQMLRLAKEMSFELESRKEIRQYTVAIEELNAKIKNQQTKDIKQKKK